MKHRKEILIHTACWLAMAALMIPFFRQMYDAGEYTKIGNIAITMISAAALFYACFFWVWPLIRLRGRRWLVLLALLPAPAFYGVVWFGLYHLLYAVMGWPAVMTLEDAIVRTPYNVVVLMIVSAAVWGIREAARRNRENRQLQLDNEAMEMDYLRMQFNPHFLFNMLNNLYYCAFKIDKPLADHVERIANLMDYAIRVSRDGLVELDTEVAHIRNYTELFRMRFAPNFHAEITVQGDTAGFRIPPLLLIPFVENAFKHGELDNPQHPVLVRINITKEVLVFTVQNLVAGHAHRENTPGVGLPSIRRRLQRAFPGRHQLHTGETAGVYSTNLHINL